MRHIIWVTVVLAACGGAPGHHSSSVASAQVSAANYKCGAYAVRTGDFTLDGEPVTMWMPCWDFGKDPGRYTTRTDRAHAAKLAEVERTQCIGLVPRALERSPFVQDQAIDEIVPHRSGEQIRGAHVVFKPVPGLTVSWMRRAIACHQARWRALGKPPTYLAGDPTLVDDAEISVTEVDNHIIVLIATDSATGAQIALDRARDLTSERTASR